MRKQLGPLLDLQFLLGWTLTFICDLFVGHVWHWSTLVLKSKNHWEKRPENMVPTHSCHRPLTTSSAGELLALQLVNLPFSNGVCRSHTPILIILNRPHQTTIYGIIRSRGSPCLVKQAWKPQKTKRKESERLWFWISKSCWIVTTVTHICTMTEEKGMALVVEQKQEMGTAGNLCTADQANASVNWKRD